VKGAGFLLLASMLLGACAALAATAIAVLTGATLSPAGGALLGAAFGLSGGFTSRRARGPRVLTALARAVLAGATAAVVVTMLQHP